MASTIRKSRVLDADGNHLVAVSGAAGTRYESMPTNCRRTEKQRRSHDAHN